MADKDEESECWRLLEDILKNRNKVYSIIDGTVEQYDAAFTKIVGLPLTFEEVRPKIYKINLKVIK